jgi:hypothetical protein
MKHQQPNLLALRINNKRATSKQAPVPGHLEGIGTGDPR